MTGLLSIIKKRLLYLFISRTENDSSGKLFGNTHVYVNATETVDNFPHNWRILCNRKF